MDKKHPGRNHTYTYLLSLINESNGLEWLFVRSLKNDDVLVIKTSNTLYTMKITDHENGNIMLSSNGTSIPEKTEAMIIGSSLSNKGTMIKIGGIAAGLWLRIFIKGKGEVILSPTQVVWVNGFKILSIEAKNVH